MKKDTKQSTVSSEYHARLNSWGRNFDAIGSTVQEAILNLKPGNIKGKSVLTIEHDGKKKEKILNSIQGSRLFNAYGMTKEVALKNMTLMFDAL